METSFPPAVSDLLDKAIGLPRKVTWLSGIGGPGAYRCDGPDGRVVVKIGTSRVERAFYEEVAPKFRSYGVGISELLGSGCEDGCDWIAIEAVPEPLPWDRLGVGRAAIVILSQMHRMTWGDPPDLSVTWAAFGWDRQISLDAVQCFPEFVREGLLTRLLRLQEDAQVVFEPLCLVSGDPNPTNWRLRADGSPVLLDWARAGIANPAIDLAICLPGLPDHEAIRTMAHMYLSVRPDLSTWDAGTLTRRIWLARLWTFVDFLASKHRGELPGSAEPAAKRLVRGLPGWVGD